MSPEIASTTLTSISPNINLRFVADLGDPKQNRILFYADRRTCNAKEFLESLRSKYPDSFIEATANSINQIGTIRAVLKHEGTAFTLELCTQWWVNNGDIQVLLSQNKA